MYANVGDEFEKCRTPSLVTAISDFMMLPAVMSFALSAAGFQQQGGAGTG